MNIDYRIHIKNSKIYSLTKVTGNHNFVLQVYYSKKIFMAVRFLSICFRTKILKYILHFNNYLTSCREAKPLLSRVSHEEFCSQLLPAIQKAMLRNPEIILPCLGYVLSGLSLDLSQYALDIAKSITSEL